MLQVKAPAASGRVPGRNFSDEQKVTMAVAAAYGRSKPLPYKEAIERMSSGFVIPSASEVYKLKNVSWDDASPQQKAILIDNLAHRMIHQATRAGSINCAEPNFEHPLCGTGFKGLFIASNGYAFQAPGGDHKVHFSTYIAALTYMDAHFLKHPRKEKMATKLPASHSNVAALLSLGALPALPALPAPPAVARPSTGALMPQFEEAAATGVVALSELARPVKRARLDKADAEMEAMDIATTVAMPHVSPNDSVSRAGSPSLMIVPAPAKERCISPGLSIIYQETFHQRFDDLTRPEQLDATCGLNPDLMEFARAKYGMKEGGMKAEKVKEWYNEDREKRMPVHLKGKKFGTKNGDVQVCHIISVAKGGHEWPCNFFLAVVEINRYFEEYLPKEWDNYIGLAAKKCAEGFARWVALRVKVTLTFGAFDPVLDYAAVRSHR